ncbi:hypothetical protein [Amycolatopsis sp. NPDC059021]|uniref:hypothetical protein n=1 Tax=Amycolatopsis sp. NPDC059021 TaxID=3346704 RepID=UPI003673595B
MRFKLRKAAGVGFAAAALMGIVATGTASAQETSPAASVKPASVLETPPECEQLHRTNNCWDYVTWFWTYGNCRADHNMWDYDHSKYDTADCFQFSGGTNVGLYWHRP